ncbi:mitochondrial ribosomal protein L51 [Nemania sp. FL0916]|nr:mitochondrial ribosomal protein L51 [Nemania sp. FL0916]
MVNPGKRMNHLKAALMKLRHGPGAAILPPEITMIHMDFATKWHNGHLGPRKFWRECLPRLKYWNPAVPVLVNRTTDQEGPATMTIYFRKDPLSIAEVVRTMPPLAQQPHSSIKNEFPAPSPAEQERVETINMKNVHSDKILEAFLDKTGATLVNMTPDEEAEMRRFDDLTERAAFDRAIVKKFIDGKRREERTLALARQEAEAIKAANQ